MTTITASVAVTGGSATLFERTLLRTASLLDAYATSRLARRTSNLSRALMSTQATHADARADAQACGALGMLPR